MTSSMYQQHRRPPLQKTQGWGTRFPLWERKNSKVVKAGPPARGFLITTRYPSPLRGQTRRRPELLISRASPAQRVPHPNVVLFDVRVGFHGSVELGILEWDRFNLRVSSFRLRRGGPGSRGHHHERGCPILRALCEGWDSEMPAPSGSDHVPTTKSNSTRPRCSGLLISRPSPAQWVPHSCAFFAQEWDSTAASRHRFCLGFCFWVVRQFPSANATTLNKRHCS